MSGGCSRASMLRDGPRYIVASAQRQVKLKDYIPTGPYLGLSTNGGKEWPWKKSEMRERYDIATCLHKLDKSYPSFLTLPPRPRLPPSPVFHHGRFATGHSGCPRTFGQPTMFRPYLRCKPMSSRAPRLQSNYPRTCVVLPLRTA